MTYSNDIGTSQLLLTATSTATAPASTSPVRTNGTTHASTTATPLSNSGVQTSFSTAASLMAQPSPDSDVRADKVAALQQAIAAGTYNVSASDVADKLIKGMTN